MRKLLLSIVILCCYLTSANVYAFETKAEYAVVMDYETGTVLFQKQADKPMVPSSMTKLMTVYLVFERLQKNILKLEDKFTVSEKAWRMGGSKMFLRHTERVSIDDLLHGIAVQSGNDACVTIAEGIANDEESFARLMTKTGINIGLTNSIFKNATGWPDEGHYMSALDIATLSRRIIKDFPEFYHYFSIPEFKYSNIKQKNRNMLLYRDIGVDGLKTGHTDDAGYGVAVSGKQGDKRMIVVVNGLSSEMERADEAERLLNYGFRYFEKMTLFTAGQVIETAKIWQGAKSTVPLVVAQDIKLLVPKLHADKIEISIAYESPIKAPVTKGAEIANMIIRVPEMGEYSFPLVIGESVGEAGLFRRMVNNLTRFLGEE